MSMVEEATPGASTPNVQAITGDEHLLQSLTSCVKTFTHGFCLPDYDTHTFGEWMRHPLCDDKRWHQVCLTLYEDSVMAWLHWKSSSNPASSKIGSHKDVEPGFIWIFTYRLFDKSHENDVIVGGTHLVLPSSTPETWSEKVVDNLPLALHDDSAKFFVSVSVSVIHDKDICTVLQASEPILLPSRTSTQTITKLLWESRKHADLTVVTSNGKEISVHRCFLIVSSPVFEAMFTHDTLEKESGRWVLKDLAHDVVFQMLQFIYLEEVTTRDVQVLIELLEVANRYDLPRLTAAVTNALMNKVRSDKSLGEIVLPAAHAYSLEYLKTVSEEAVVSCMSFKDYVPHLLLATDCAAKRLLKLSAVCLLVNRLPPELDENWMKFQSAHPNLAKFLLDMQKRSIRMTCEGEVKGSKTKT